MKLGDWDPDVFYKFRDVILDQSPSCGSKLRRDIQRGIPRLWTNYYKLENDKDIAFEIGRFFYGIRDFKNALKYYQTSHDAIGQHHVTYHNMGLCYYSMAEYEAAFDCFEKSLALSPTYEKARTWKNRVLEELNQIKKRKAEQAKSSENLVEEVSAESTPIVKMDHVLVEVRTVARQHRCCFAQRPVCSQVAGTEDPVAMTVDLAEVS